jgi:2-keto-3-deoxy-L-rhamnonate aldolase RhmA
MIDMEHSPYTAEQASLMVHAVTGASAGSCLPFIRIPCHTVEWIKWALDSGAAGIVIPMVNTAEEMEEIAANASYPPRGNRSFGPALAPFGDIDVTSTMTSYLQKARDGEIALIPIIETAQGVQNVEAILSVDGVSGAFVGPQDLRLSLGLPAGRDGPEPEWNDALERILKAGKTVAKPIGSMGVGEELVRKRVACGMRFFLCTLDNQALIAGLSKDLAAARKGLV